MLFIQMFVTVGYVCSQVVNKSTQPKEYFYNNFYHERKQFAGGLPSQRRLQQKRAKTKKKHRTIKNQSG